MTSFLTHPPEKVRREQAGLLFFFGLLGPLGYLSDSQIDATPDLRFLWVRLAWSALLLLAAAAAFTSSC